MWHTQLKISEKLCFDIIMHLWKFCPNPLRNDWVMTISNFNSWKSVWHTQLKICKKLCFDIPMQLWKFCLNPLKYDEIWQFQIIPPENMCGIHNWKFLKYCVLTFLCISEKFVKIHWNMTEIWQFQIIPPENLFGIHNWKFLRNDWVMTISNFNSWKSVWHTQFVKSCVLTF